MGRVEVREIRCEDEECHALNAKAFDGCIEVVNRSAGVRVRAPVDVTRDVLLRCRRCGREKLIKGIFFARENNSKS